MKGKYEEGESTLRCCRRVIRLRSEKWLISSSSSFFAAEIMGRAPTQLTRVSLSKIGQTVHEQKRVSRNPCMRLSLSTRVLTMSKKTWCVTTEISPIRGKERRTRLLRHKTSHFRLSFSSPYVLITAIFREREFRGTVCSNLVCYWNWDWWSKEGRKTINCNSPSSSLNICSTWCLHLVSLKQNPLRCVFAT